MKVKSCAEPVVEAVGSQSCDGVAVTMSCCFPGIDEKGGSVTVSSSVEGDLSVSPVKQQQTRAEKEMEAFR